MARVSIVVPNYNHARYLQQRVDSVFQQTLDDYEVILLDDCSSDGSAALLTPYASHPKVVHFAINRERAGTFKQWQEAVRCARGEYVWIAESDDVAEPTFLERLVPLLDRDTNVGIAYCQSQIIDEYGTILFDNQSWTTDLDPILWHKSFTLDGNRALRDYFIFRNVIPNASAALFRRELFQRVSLDIVDFRYTGDWMAWVQMLCGSSLAFTPERLNYFRRHSATTRTRTRFDQAERYLKENYRIVDFIVRTTRIDETRRRSAYDFLARKYYREVGGRNLLSARSLLLIAQLSRFDRLLGKRLGQLLLQKIERKLGLGTG